MQQEREPLQSDQGDVFTLLRAYHEWLQLKWHNENTRKWCHKLGIEEQRYVFMLGQKEFIRFEYVRYSLNVHTYHTYLNNYLRDLNQTP